jgi:hypothetical protein
MTWVWFHDAMGNPELRRCPTHRSHDKIPNIRTEPSRGGVLKWIPKSPWVLAPSHNFITYGSNDLNDLGFPHGLETSTLTRRLVFKKKQAGQPVLLFSICHGALHACENKVWKRHSMGFGTPVLIKSES